MPDYGIVKEAKSLPFTTDELRELPRVISVPRFATYLRASGNDTEGALKLYQWNLEVSAAFIVPLQVCEVAARNGIVEVLEIVHGPNWPWSVGFTRTLPSPSRSYNSKADLQSVSQRMPTTGKVVAELKFAFWENMFTARHDQNLWTPHFRAAFPHADKTIPTHVTRGKARLALKRVRKLRNRIAHHEPIFTRNIADDYAEIHDIISWRSPVAAAWMDQTQGVTALIPTKPHP